MRTIKQWMLLIALALCLPMSSWAQVLYTCGDSTMANYATDGSTPTRGWGQYFGAFFKPGLTVKNYGKGGMDVQGFVSNQAYWPTIKKNLKPGDYVLLQFAHNDEKNGGMDGNQLYEYYLAKGDTEAAAAVDKRGSIPHDTYVKTLRMLVSEIRAAGATPLFASSICRMYFAGNDIRRNGRHDLGDNFDVLTADGPKKGNSVPADDHSMDYTYQMQQLAKELDVPFIDMMQSTRELYLLYGDERCHSILGDGAGSTHLSVAGAALIARQAAELMQKQGILADYISLSDAELSASPSEGNLGEAYVGNVLTKEFTLTGFGLSPEAGAVTITSNSDAFVLSTDKSRWESSVSLPYTGGTLVGTFYVKASLKNPGELSSTLTASSSNSSLEIPVSATAVAIPGSGAVSVNWPLATNNEYTLDGETTVLPMELKGLKVAGYDNGILLQPQNGAWPDGDIDESPDRYVEFGITAPADKALQVNRLAMMIGATGTDLMQCHVTYSTEEGYGNPTTFYSPNTMKDGEMVQALTEALTNLKAGQTLRMRVYPWTKSKAENASLRLQNVSIGGYAESTSTPATLTWPLDKGKDNPSSADTQSDAFTFTTYSVGSDLVVTGTGKPSDRTGTMYQPLVNNQNGYTDAASLIFQVRPKKGLTFQLKKVSFYGTKNGTSGGLLNAVVDVDGDVRELGKDLALIRNNDNANGNQAYFEFPVDGVVVYDNTLTFKIGISKLGNTKTVTIHDVVLEGEISGKEIAVPVFTITAVPSDPEAGAVTIVPNTSKISEGTPVSVSASENFGYHFIEWTAGGKTVSTDNPYEFSASADLALVAKYKKVNTYPMELSVLGGANDYKVSVSPEGHLIDGVRYYEEGTDVVLTASNNRILTFTNWEDNTTDCKRQVKMDGPKDIVANYSAEDYIVGWDLYYDNPAGDRAADYKAESDNTGLLSLMNESGKTTTWLAHGITRGLENGRPAARVWKDRSDKNYFQIQFSAREYSNLKVSSALSYSYNTYSRFFIQYSTDGKEFTTFGEITPSNRSWNDVELALPAEADNAERVYIRWYPDWESELAGNETNLDGLCIADIYVLADRASTSDDTAPVLTAAIPANGSEGASVNGSIVLSFDEKIIAGKGTARLDGKALDYSIAGKSVVFRYNGLKYNTAYTFTMPEGVVTDRNGNAAPAVTLNFTTMERTQPEARLFDAIVAQDGSGDYTTVQAAIDAAPSNRIKPWLIFVKNGNYKEHVDVPATKPFLHFIGQDRDKTVILDDLLCGGDNALHVSVGATVVVNSNDCFFENITLENSWGHEKQQGPQALALNTIGDRTIFNNVAMLSYQDTWITPSNQSYRAYVHNSLIEGAVDFIYNGGDVYIDNTTLLINRESGGYIVAPYHTEATKWGYVFRDCEITAPGDPSKTTVWLGRPWHGSPKTVFLNTRALVNIPASGWYETMGGLPVLWADWNTVDANGNPIDLSQRRDTYYIEDRETHERTYGTAKNFLTDEEASEYTISNVLTGSDNWQPAIKVEACDKPIATYESGMLTWDAVPYAICYLVTDGDKFVGFTTETSMAVTGENLTVQAVNEFGGLSEKAHPGTSGAESIVSDKSDMVITAVYDLSGRRLTTPVPGINIIHYTDASGMPHVVKQIVK